MQLKLRGIITVFMRPTFHDKHQHTILKALIFDPGFDRNLFYSIKCAELLAEFDLQQNS